MSVPAEIIALRRAAVVDAHATRRHSTANLVATQLGMDVVHAGASVSGLADWARAEPFARRPHLVVCDAPTGTTASRESMVLEGMRERGVRVVILADLDRPEIARRVAGLEVDGIASDADDEATIIDALRRALAGDRAITATAAAALTPRAVPPFSELERTLLGLYARGRTLDEAAKRLGVSRESAREHLDQVRRKYALQRRHVETKADLARRAWEDGLLESFG